MFECRRLQSYKLRLENFQEVKARKKERKKKNKELHDELKRVVESEQRELLEEYENHLRMIANLAKQVTISHAVTPPENNNTVIIIGSKRSPENSPANSSNGPNSGANTSNPVQVVAHKQLTLKPAQIWSKIKNITTTLTETELDMIRDDAKRAVFQECLNKFFAQSTLQNFYILCEKDVSKSFATRKIF